MAEPLFSHRDRVVVVTGGGTGIGRAIAEAFARQGARVLICGRRSEVLERVAGDWSGEGEIAFQSADVSRFDQVQAVAQEAERRWGRIDVWVNNAGVSERRTLPEADEEHLERLVAVNVRGVFHGCRAALSAFRRGGGGGVILNISSYLASHGGESGALPVYSATKGAVSALTRALAVRHGPEGIRVNAICPALVPTDLNPEIWEGRQDREARERELAARYPLGRLGRPYDVAFAALFLASDEAGWITGQELTVDGGLSAH